MALLDLLREQGGEWTGDNEFRLMPADTPYTSPATLTVMAGAGGSVVSLAYTWRHPDDGPQDGALVLGRADDGDAVVALWADTWHQSTARLFPDAEAAAGSVLFEYEYAPSWTWQVGLTVAQGSLQIVMRNSVPEGERSVPAGAYDAMVMGLRPA